ncbi:MAG: cyclase family protein [Desulfurococcales archaeon]|nr:cyclase family protein [Desulfurococcales archaeon]
MGRSLEGCRLLDLTMPLSEDTPTYPGDPPVTIETIASHDSAGYYMRRLCLSEHAGTHIDAPAHFHPNGLTVDMLPPVIHGKLAVVDVSEYAGSTVPVRLLDGPAGDASLLLLYAGFDWSRALTGEDLCRMIPAISGEGARILSRLGRVRAVLTDAPTVDCYPYEAHRVLLGSNIVLVENVYLRGVSLEAIDGSQAFIVPLRLAGGSGSPARVLACARE